MSDLIEAPIRQHFAWKLKQKQGNQLLPPGPLAENLDPRDILTALRYHLTLKKPEGHLLSSWQHVEYALNQHVTELDDDMRRKYIDDVMHLLAGILNIDGTRATNSDSSMYIDALSLNSFLPLFTKRALGKVATRQDCAQLYASTGVILDQLGRPRSSQLDVSYRKTKQSENLARALAARSLQPELIMYIASPREEGSNQPDLNHDSYFIKQGVKLPIQKKLIDIKRAYSHPVQVLYVEPTAQHALMRADIEVPDAKYIGDFPATVLLSAFVADEAMGRELARDETLAINIASRSIAARFRFADSLAA